MYTITAKLDANVEKGKQYNSSSEVTINVDAYDPIKVVIKQNEKDKSVEVQPGDKVSFLLIRSSIYTPPNAADDKCLTYSTDKAQEIKLEYPQVFLGKKAISELLGEVKTIKFSNNLEGEAEKVSATIEILVGRDAIT